VTTHHKIITSFSELDTFRQCPLKWELGWRQRWWKEPDEKRQRGSNWHLIMQAHYKTLQEQQRARGRVTLHPSEIRRVMDACRHAVLPLLYDHETGEQSEQQALLEWMYDGYVQQWRNDPEWWVEDIERTMVVPLPAVTPGLHGRLSKRYFIKVKIDLVVKNPRGQRLVVDHKSSQYLKNSMEFQIDDQFGIYTWALRQAGRPVFAAVHNNARTHRNKGPMRLEDRFKREIQFRSDTELWNLALDAARTAQAMHGHDQIYSSPDPERCKWKCDFLDVHLEMRRGIPPATALKDYGFVRRLRNG
jgi:hypothetical protein